MLAFPSVVRPVHVYKQSAEVAENDANNITPPENNRFINTELFADDLTLLVDNEHD
jgi:hypothetical protein